MDIYKYLELDKLDCSVAIIKNAKSNAMGKKDIIKVEGLLDIDLDVLGFIDCDITVNVIDDGKIIEKKKLTMPETIRNVVSCKNPRCITSIERGIDQVFKFCLLYTSQSRRKPCIQGIFVLMNVGAATFATSMRRFS